MPWKSTDFSVVNAHVRKGSESFFFNTDMSAVGVDLAFADEIGLIFHVSNAQESM